MSSWAKRETESTGQSGVASWLAKVPGYSGYKQKESRRDEDKRVREGLAREYAQYTQRLASLQGELVRARRLPEINTIERLEHALRLFTDRLRTATYGYGGLFSERPIDEGALDQLAAFDRSLGDGLDELREGLDALEGAVRMGGDLAGPASQVQGTIDGLSRRFDLRGQVVETGRAQEGAAIEALFTPRESEEAHVAGDLHFGDAVSIGGTDYLVEGRMEFHAAESAWRQYLLRGADPEGWLHVPPSTRQPMALLLPVADAPGDGPSLAAGDKSLTQTAEGRAAAEVVGEAGQQTGRSVQYRQYSGDGGAIGFSYDWGGERQVLVGHTLDPLEITVYPKA